MAETLDEFRRMMVRLKRQCTQEGGDWELKCPDTFDEVWERAETLSPETSQMSVSRGMGFSKELCLAAVRKLTRNYRRKRNYLRRTLIRLPEKSEKAISPEMECSEEICKQALRQLGREYWGRKKLLKRTLPSKLSAIKHF